MATRGTPLTNSPMETSVTEGPSTASLVAEAMIWGLISSVAFPLGAYLSLTVNVPQKLIGLALAFGGGALLFALSLELFGAAIHLMDSGVYGPSQVLVMMGSSLLGAFLFSLINKMTEATAGGQDWRFGANYGSVTGDEDSGVVIHSEMGNLADYDDEPSKQRSTGFNHGFNHGNKPVPVLTIWAGLALDTVPECLVIGMLAMQQQMSIALIAGVFLSNFPAAASTAVIMREQAYRKNSILLMWTALSIGTALGAGFIPLFFAFATPDNLAVQYFQAGIEGLAGGAMLALISSVVLPESTKLGGPSVGILTVCGFIAAVAVKVFSPPVFLDLF